MAAHLSILVLGGAGIQNTYVARELAQSGHHVRVLTRDSTSEHAVCLASTPNITIFEGDTYNEKPLAVGLEGIDAVFVNTNGFAIGEKSEIYWGIRIYELCIAAGVKHFIYSTLPYVSKKGAFQSQYRVPFVDGKAKVAEYLRAQSTRVMNWSLLETGPYADHFLTTTLRPVKQENGIYLFKAALGNEGCMPLVSLDDLAWFARYMFEHSDEFQGDLLSVGIEHASGRMIAEAFTKVTGLPADFVPKNNQEKQKDLSDVKLGTAHSPGFDDATLVTERQMFDPWWNIWAESHGNTGLWTRDYSRLDMIKPDRIRSIEQWMQFVKYEPDIKSKEVLQTGLSSLL
ncbi:hypothetical protein G7046_g8399 [Stylonectria norvegica]|nr:hypothetical protein G7046_g8399 [Stylonectria norvegica]